LKRLFGNIFIQRDGKGSGVHQGLAEKLALKESSVIGKFEEPELQEDLFWKKKSRTRWFKEGYQNTKKIHQTTINNISFNKICRF
jgi:hypothetical protein